VLREQVFIACLLLPAHDPRPHGYLQESDNNSYDLLGSSVLIEVLFYTNKSCKVGIQFYR
jgi:hypothetical protein